MSSGVVCNSVAPDDEVWTKLVLSKTCMVNSLEVILMINLRKWLHTAHGFDFSERIWRHAWYLCESFDQSRLVKDMDESLVCFSFLFNFFSILADIFYMQTCCGIVIDSFQLTITIPQNLSRVIKTAWVLQLIVYIQ